jgi:ribosomal protein L7/L12
MNNYKGIHKALKDILGDDDLMRSVILFMAEKHPSFVVKAHSEVTGIPLPVKTDVLKYSLILQDVGPNKIPCIKLHRELTKSELKEAKDAIDWHYGNTIIHYKLSQYEKLKEDIASFQKLGAHVFYSCYEPESKCPFNRV